MNIDRERGLVCLPNLHLFEDLIDWDSFASEFSGEG